MKTFSLECGCRVEHQRPDRLLQMCPACTAEFTERHARSLEDYRRRYVVPAQPQAQVAP
jgi:hypothetical protein